MLGFVFQQLLRGDMTVSKNVLQPVTDKSMEFPL